MFGYAQIILGAVIYSGLPDYLKLTGVSNIPSFFYGLLLIAALILRSSFGAVSLSIDGAQICICKIISIIGWLVLFVLFGVISVVYHDANLYATQDLARRISAAVFFGCLLFFVGFQKELTTEQKSAYCLIRNLMWAVVFGGGLLAVSVLLGVYQLAFITPGSCRQGGFYMNANGAAYALTLSIWFSSRVIESATWRALFQAFLIFALLLTMSRSGYIAAAIIFTSLCIARKVDAWIFLKALTLILFLGVAVAWAQGEFSKGSCLWNAVMDRTIKFEVGGDGEPNRGVVLDVGSAERLKLGMEAWNKFKENVFFGSGIDAEKGERSHNQFLASLSQHGLGGGALFVGFWMLVIWAGVPKSVAAGLFIVSMFDHNFFYNRYVLIVVICGIGVTILQNQNSCLKVKNG